MNDENVIKELSGRMEQDLSDCIYRTTKEAELLMDQISLKAREKARSECEKAFNEYEQKVQLVLEEMRETIDSKSNIIVDKIKEALVRKSESVSGKMVSDLIGSIEGKTAKLAGIASGNQLQQKPAEEETENILSDITKRQEAKAIEIPSEDSKVTEPEKNEIKNTTNEISEDDTSSKSSSEQESPANDNKEESKEDTTNSSDEKLSDIVSFFS